MEEIGRELERRETEVPPYPPSTFPEVIPATNIGPSQAVYYYIQSDLASGFNVTNSGGSMAYQNNSWFLVLSATETVFVSKPSSGTQLALDGGAMTVGTQIKVTPFNKSDIKTSQKWKRDNKYFQMNGFVMEVQGGGKSDGTPVILGNKISSKPENTKQQFSLIPVPLSTESCSTVEDDAVADIMIVEKVEIECRELQI